MSGTATASLAADRADGSAAGSETTRALGASDDEVHIFARLAELWAQLAQLDPEVAKRLPTYEA
jgi:alcohol dehydrogenase class IV